MTPTLSYLSFGLDPLSNSADLADTGAPWYPACDVQKLDEERYAITLAVPGYGQENLKISTHDNLLTVTGHRPSPDQNGFILREIATGDFERKFQLADYVSVTGADLKDGLLRIEFVREVPDELKPRRIEIKSGQSPRLLQSNDNCERAA
ncbi:Hsp20 family protein [Asticcacaulis sp.]|uniref:Hsp20 family protein n=1 Tax=Asticcacaulis sp. TaxID=1872648 RepID=UPI003F7BFE7B